MISFIVGAAGSSFQIILMVNHQETFWKDILIVFEILVKIRKGRYYKILRLSLSAVSKKYLKLNIKKKRY